MFRYSSFIILVMILLSGCVQKSKKDPIFDFPFSNQTKNVSNETNDLLMLQALFATQEHDFANATKIYKELYDKTNDKEYLKSAARLSLSQNNLTISDELTKFGYENYKDDNDFKRLYVAQLLKDNNVQEAKKITEDLLKTEKTEQNYNLFGAILAIEQDFDGALKTYEASYKLNPNEKTLLLMSDLNLKLGRVNVAISLLETFTRINGCTPNVCSKLISIYATNQNIDGLLWVYLQAYDTFKDADSAQKVVELYIYKNQVNNAVKFLEKNNINPNQLIDLYAYQKNYVKAKRLSEKMYKDTNDIDYLARIAIFTYEEAKDKNTIIDEVSKYFEKVVALSDDPLYLNYYGYLLIDHDVDIEKGIELVKKALLKEPDSHYYLDSLAWGYYKINMCKEALEVMDSFYDKLPKDKEEEIVGHYNEIKKCVENR